jgi:hypothetical protein
MDSRPPRERNHEAHHATNEQENYGCYGIRLD